jgi:hypothetical protein
VIASPSPSPTPVATAPVAAAPISPSLLPVTFTGLRSGTYPAHLHSACNGSQAFHIAVLQSLVVSGGAGTIQVPAGDFGRGLCVIVYSSSTLSSVLKARQI